MVNILDGFFDIQPFRKFVQLFIGPDSILLFDQSPVFDLAPKSNDTGRHNFVRGANKTIC